MLFNGRVSAFLCFLAGITAWGENHVSSRNQLDPAGGTVFFYFAYGTNMLEKRMRVKVPDATIYGAAKLENHRLDFSMEVPWWNGAVATISKDPASHVWGVLWIIKVSDMDSLDEQEGVNAGWYHSEKVVVLYAGTSKMNAVTYVQNLSPRKLSPIDDYPERQPSLTYIKVMIMAAVQSGIPDDYVQSLYSIRNNGRVATPELLSNFLNKYKSTNVLL